MVLQLRHETIHSATVVATLEIDGQAYSAYGRTQERADEALIYLLGTKLRTTVLAAESIIINGHGAAYKAGSK